MLGRQLDTGITNFDDAFYAQKAKEIYISGNLWIVTHDGTPSFENPPLPFWPERQGRILKRRCSVMSDYP